MSVSDASSSFARGGMHIKRWTPIMTARSPRMSL
jgi:hypothetical protein